MSKKIKMIGELLPGIVKTAKTRSKSNEGLKKKWSEIVEEEIQSHTEAMYVKGNTLFVKVDSAVWLHYVSAFKIEEILKGLQAGYSKKFILEIKFYVGNLERKD